MLRVSGAACRVTTHVHLLMFPVVARLSRSTIRDKSMYVQLPRHVE